MRALGWTLRPVVSTATSIGLLALMASGPFLFPVHTDPIPSFWSEWWAAALGLAAAIIGLIAIRGRPLVLPQVLLIPAALLLVLLLQFGFDRLAFPQIGLIHAANLLWAALLMTLGRQLIEAISLARIADIVAGGMALGALVGAGIALAQWVGVHPGGGWMFPKLGTAVYGNLGQANHHAHHAWLGIASVFYLRGRHRVSRPCLWIATLLLAFGSVLSGSRSVFIYPLVITAAAIWMQHRDRRQENVSLVVDAALLLPVLVALSSIGLAITPHITDWLPSDLGRQVPGGTQSVMAGTRLFESVSGPSARLEIARSAWAAFLEQPWLGQGVGNYSWGSFVAAAASTGEASLGVAENAHNLILQLLAEYGAPATLFVVLVLGIWAKGLVTTPWGPAQFWCGALLGIGGVHAMLEYPLWYAYFLGPTAFLLGATDRRPLFALPARRGVVYVVLLALLGASILVKLRQDYAIIEAAAYRPLAADPDRERAWRISMDRMLKLHHDSLLSPWALLAFATMADPSRQQAGDRADLCERGIRFSPARWLVARCAMQLAIAGRAQDAEKLARDVLRAYPSQRATTLDELALGAREYTEILPLWQAAVNRR